MDHQNEGTSLWVKLNTLALLLMLIILITIGMKSCISDMQNGDDSSKIKDEDLRLLEEYENIQEMKLNRIREDAYNAERRYERELSLLKERVVILEGKIENNTPKSTVNVGNVNTNVK